MPSKLSFGKVNCQFYVHKFRFKAAHQRSHKTLFATIKPTIYLPKHEFSIQLSPFQKHFTAMILSFRTDRPGKTVQTQIRSSLIRVYTVCHSICIVWTHYSMVEPHSSNFRVITTNFLGVRIFRKFTICFFHLKKFGCKSQHCQQCKTRRQWKAMLRNYVRFQSQMLTLSNQTLRYTQVH